MKRMHWKHRWIERLSLKWRLILISFLVIVITVVVITACLSMYSYGAMRSQVMDAHGQLVGFSAQSISDRLDEALRVSKLVLSQDTVTNAVTKAQKDGKYSLSDQIRDAKQISEFLKSLESSSNLVRVRVQMLGNVLYGNEQVNFFHLTGEEKERLTALLQEGRYYEIRTEEFDYIFRNPRRILSVVRPMTSTASFYEVIGAVIVDVSMEEIEALMEGMLGNDGDAVALFDRSGERITAVGDPELAGLPELGGDMGEWKQTGRPSALCYELSVGPDQWTLSYRIRSDSLYLPVNGLIRNMLGMLAIALLVALGITVTSGTAQSRRLMRLVAAMDRVREGDMSVRVEEGGSNEVGRMERTFNLLLDELQHTLDAKVADTRQMGLLELRLLQSQINPHFLYNTLNLICWRLTSDGDEEGARYVQALAQFYRIGLNHGKELISLEEELRHVQLYVEIQNFRLDNRIKLQITLTPECRTMLMPGNILQPLVENAISAGILEKPEGSGTVSISCRREGDDLYIVISDDGVGMDLALMERLLSQRSDNHYGAWNVHKRLELRYGEGYGLRYSINSSGGVDVQIRIRAQDQAE